MKISFYFRIFKINRTINSNSFIFVIKNKTFIEKKYKNRI